MHVKLMQCSLLMAHLLAVVSNWRDVLVGAGNRAAWNGRSLDW